MILWIKQILYTISNALVVASPGFGNGCATCPIRRMYNRTCSDLELDEIISAGKKLYRTNKEYRDSVKIEVDEYPNFRPYVGGCQIV